MAEPVFRGVVLDLDGVVADSEPLHVQAWVEVLGALGLGPEAVGESTMRGWVGIPDVDIVGCLVRELKLPLSPAELLERKRRAFRELIPRALGSFAGVVERLRSWDGAALGMATATARREAELMLETLGVRQAFRTVVTGDEVSRPKPAPDCYLLAVERLGLKPAECAAVEDAPHGLRSAHEAGLYPLAVATSFPAETLNLARRVFPAVPEALDWLARRLSA